MSDISRVEAILLGALRAATPEGRDAYLDEQCRGEPDVRAQVERLLQAHAAARDFLETAAPDAARAAPPAGAAGEVVGGRYKLLEPIGEGGMGSVWMAQQTEPVRRVVAVKLIKAGMDTGAVLARFEAERQALALMDHPNIARVLDAGATGAGRPFFAMELVKGVPITRYCDDHRLSLRERLDLFIPICQAVQHAHQKGVIHRDLKPSNVLVARYDDRPVPKVIDFGVAKAAGQPLTDLTLVTGFGAVVGTPEYMSPEQAQFNQLDVDTRSDVYALGVLLYELLTGTTPVTRGELERAGLLEVLRMIREQEPPRPSTRLSGSTTLPEIASARSSEPKALPGLVRNDLDWVVMKALEKDRNRRYETALGLAADVRRYLDGEAVNAHPPSASYRVRKFARKHRAAIYTASAFAGLMVGAALGSALLAVKAQRAEADAKNAARKADANLQLAQAIQVKLVEALDDAELKRVQAVSRNDPRASLLQKARSLARSGVPEVRAGAVLREYATMAVLGEGQRYASLLPPVHHDGSAIVASFSGKSGRRWVTLGADRTARLRDPFTGRQIAILRRGAEEVLDAGISPDGATAFTHATDGVVRFWEPRDGTFRAETEPRPDRVRLIFSERPGRDPGTTVFPGRPTTLFDLGGKVWLCNELSRDRLITSVVQYDFEKSPNPNGNAPAIVSRLGPVELWDTRDGRRIGVLAGEGPAPETYRYLCDDRWIIAGDRQTPARIFSAEDGRAFGPLDTGGIIVPPWTISVSPSGKWAGVLASAKIHLWDTASWRLRTVTSPEFAKSWGNPAEDKPIPAFFAGDDLVSPGDTWFRAADARPVFRTPEGIMWWEGELGVDRSLRVWDRATGREIPPPKGRLHARELARFARDGRVVSAVDYGNHEPDWWPFFDVAAEKPIPWGRVDSPVAFDPARGWVTGRASGPDAQWRSLSRLPPADRLSFPPALVELWAQVAVCGELDEEGKFAHWDEPTWDGKRQELAAMPAPHADFPFPGHVTTDRLHWLRREYKGADDDTKPRLARQLLERAEALGDRAEVSRWRALLPNPDGEGAPAPR